jgi:hypothetical protein
METIAYITSASGIHPAYNALALRTGLLISTATFAVGNAYMCILHDRLTAELNRNLTEKVRFIANYDTLQQSGLDPETVIRELKQLWNNRRNTVMMKEYKKRESLINKMYDAALQAVRLQVRNFSLMQLEGLKDSDELRVFGLDEVQGEGYERDFRISKILSLKVEPDGSPGPFAFIMIDKLAKLPAEDEAALTPLFTLPNINILTLDQLMGARKALSHWTEQLQQLLVPDTSADGTYDIAHWDRPKLAQAGKAIQEAIGTNPDLNWATALRPHFTCQVLAGEMDTKRFWQLQRDCNQVPDDSWEVLNALTAETPYPRTMPIIVVRPSLDIADENPEEDADSLKSKRKTISLD